MRFKAITVVILAFMSLYAGMGQSQSEARPFYMGFTPFPYAINLEAIEYTYGRIAIDADLIAHHFDNGVPWVEALSGAAYSDNIMNDWKFRLANTPEHHRIFVSVTPISFERTGLARYRGVRDDMPLPAPFDSYNFDHPNVEMAFMTYCEDIIAYFQPDYFMFSVEANLLMKLRPDLWESYVTLHRNVYTRLKEAHPDLPIMASMTGIDLLEGYTEANHEAQMRAFADIIDYTDYFALSLYPYMTAYMTNAIPEDMFDQLALLTDKPLAVSETGYPAQDFAIEVGGGLRLEFDSDTSKQEQYIMLLLDEAREHDFRFIINFVLRDYDELWQQIGGREDLTIAWRDTGLYDETGEERPALDVWRAALQLTVVPPES